jgi:hypothetical protein
MESKRSGATVCVGGREVVCALLEVEVSDEVGVVGLRPRIATTTTAAITMAAAAPPPAMIQRCRDPRDCAGPAAHSGPTGVNGCGVAGYLGANAPTGAIGWGPE